MTRGHSKEKGDERGCVCVGGVRFVRGRLVVL